MKTVENQEKVWDRIAPEWHEHKKIPSRSATEFLKSSTGNVLDLGSGSGRHFRDQGTSNPHVRNQKRHHDQATYQQVAIHNQVI